MSLKTEEKQNRIKTLENHYNDLDVMYKTLKKQGFSMQLITDINNKRTKISILELQEKKKIQKRLIN